MCSPFAKIRAFMRSALCAIIVWGACGPSARAAGSKRRDPVIAVRFHAEVSSYDPSFAAKVVAGNPPRQLIVEKIPSLSERDIASFYPYRATDGTYSAVFQLDRHGQAVLEALSSQVRGRFIVAAVNGRPVTLLKVDKIISDGIIFIPYGLTEGDIRALGQSYSLMGQTESDKETRKEPRTDANPFSNPVIPDPPKKNY